MEPPEKFWNSYSNSILNKRTVSGIIAVLIVVGIVGYEFFLEQKETDEIVEQGTVPKEETNTYLLPSSTTGQIVHHNFYSWVTSKK